MIRNMLFVVASVLTTNNAINTEFPSGPEGYTLEIPTNDKNLGIIFHEIERNKCKTRDCIVFQKTIQAFGISDSSGRGSAGTIYIGLPPSQYERFRRVGRILNKFLNENRAYWPGMCQFVQALVARDDFSDKSNSGFGADGLDIARRISSKKLDCLTQVDRLIPESKFRQMSLYFAYNYCLAEYRRDCGRLKPRD